MSLYDFLTNNQSILQEITFGPDGAIEVSPEEFGFDDSTLEMEVIKHQMVFEISVGQFKMRTKVWIDNLSSAANHVKKITDIEKRKEVIELIESHYREDAQLELEVAEANVEESKALLAEAQKDFDLVVDTLREIKTAWKIP